MLTMLGLASSALLFSLCFLLLQVQTALQEKNIPLHVKLTGDNPSDDIVQYVKDLDATALVMDFLPLREKMQWDEQIVSDLCSTALKDKKGAGNVPVVRVDAHNIVPCFLASPKLEYAARTIRPKITRLLPEFLTEIPEVSIMETTNQKDMTSASVLDSWVGNGKVDWDDLLQIIVKGGHFDTGEDEAGTLPVDDYFPPGRSAGWEKVNLFFDKRRLGRFDEERNDPNKDTVLSNLSPYVNFGLLSIQSVILKAKKFAREANGHTISSGAIGAYVEEAIVRRELSDNFCFYNKSYDSLDGCYPWARETLQLHDSDTREYVYSYEQLCHSKTHDELWNASQIQLRREGGLPMPKSHVSPVPVRYPPPFFLSSPFPSNSVRCNCTSFLPPVQPPPPPFFPSKDKKITLHRW
jgi:deoxyribodipyrimidine photo-lyase